MPKYLIKWNAGYGDNTAVVDCPTPQDADKEAYAAWNQDVQDNADYSAQELTEELARDYGHEFETED